MQAWSVLASSKQISELMPSEAASASLGGFEQLVDEPEVGEPPAAADNALAEESDSDFEQRGGFFCRTFVDAETERRFDAHQFRQALVLQLLQGAIIQFGPTVCFAGLHFFRPSAHHAATFEAEWRERGGWGALALDSSFFGIRLAVHAMRDHQLAQRICSSIWCICFPLRVLYATFIERASSTAQHTGGSTLVSEESGVIEVWLVVFAQYFCIGIVHGSLGTPPLYRWPVALLLALLLWYDTGFEASWGQAQETRAWLAAAMVAACILMQALEIKQRDDFGLEVCVRHLGALGSGSTQSRLRLSAFISALYLLFCPSRLELELGSASRVPAHGTPFLRPRLRCAVASSN
mmetsp:Transcript_50138/g.163273  ORF Transcript_50138/g.163273 Transcript_50138/m.163273 type:complete len:350 (+) Transcript_50138:52-1101(+)